VLLLGTPLVPAPLPPRAVGRGEQSSGWGLAFPQQRAAGTQGSLSQSPAACWGGRGAWGLGGWGGAPGGPLFCPLKFKNKRRQGRLTFCVGRWGEGRSELWRWLSSRDQLRALSLGERVSASGRAGLVSRRSGVLRRWSGCSGDLQRPFRKRRFRFCVADGLGPCVEEERCLRVGPERGQGPGTAFHTSVFTMLIFSSLFFFSPVTRSVLSALMTPAWQRLSALGEWRFKL